MNPADFETYRSLLKQKSGIIVTPEKTYLLESRLMPIVKQRDLTDLSGLAAAIQSNPNGPEMNEVIEAMTTNETSFFRDNTPFENFTNTCLPYFQKSRPTKRLKIWCAAASSGQEPYSLRMLLGDRTDMAGWNYSILGTDLSRDILDIAEKGLYTQFEVQRGLPIQMLMKYFTQIEEKWQISDEIRQAVQYKTLNLLDSFTSLGKFDLIFCRNVLIYFDEPTKADILKRLAAQMEPDSFLFLGGAETVLGITDAFVPMPNVRGLYVLKDSPHLQKPEDANNQPLAS